MIKIEESNLNRILQHMENMDIATITAFRTDSDLGFSKTKNRERNKKLESELKALGYSGFTKILGYWNERPNDPDSVAIAEESYVVLNTASSYEDFVLDMIYLCKDVDDSIFDQQAVMIWNHKTKLATLYDNKGNELETFNDFKIDNISQAWSQIGNHKLTFTNISRIEEFVDVEFSDVYNKGGNWMTAMGHAGRRSKIR